MADIKTRRNAYAELVSNPDLCVSYSDIMAGLDAPQLCAVDKPPAPGPWSSDMGMNLATFLMIARYDPYTLYVFF